MQLSYNGKRNSCSYKRNQKVFNLFSPKAFSHSNGLQRNTWFCEKNLLNMQAQWRLLRWQLWLNQFSFYIKQIQGSKNSVADSLTCERANGDHQSRTPAGKGENSK